MEDWPFTMVFTAFELAAVDDPSVIFLFILFLGTFSKLLKLAKSAEVASNSYSPSPETLRDAPLMAFEPVRSWLAMPLPLPVGAPLILKAPLGEAAVPYLFWLGILCYCYC